MVAVLRFANVLLAVASSPAAPLPADVRAAFDRGAPVVTLPPGEWAVAVPLEVRAGTRQVAAHGCTLVPAGQGALRIVSTGRDGGPAIEQLRASGEIGPGVDTLTLSAAADLKPGETVVVRCGVRPTDPAEPVREVWQTVAAVEGREVRFRQSFSEAIPNYQSLDGLRAVTADGYQETKLGEFGEPSENGSPARGYGVDHGIVRFSTPIEGLTVEGLTVRWPADSNPNGAIAINVHYARGVTIRDLTVIDPRGQCVHSAGSDGLTVDGLTVRGEGRGVIWNTAPNDAYAVSAWGGRGLYRRFHVDATGLALWGFERGASGDFEDLDYRSSLKATTPFGSFPEGEPVTIRRGRFDIGSAPYLFAAAAPPTTFEDCEFVRPLGQFVDSRQAKFRGSLSIGGKRYGEPRRGVWTKALAASAWFDLPPGLYSGGTVTLSTDQGVRKVNAPDTEVTFDGLTGRLPASRWEVLPPGFPTLTGSTAEQFRRSLAVYLADGANPVTVTVEADYRPEEK